MRREWGRQVCDQPHPLLVAKVIQCCLAGNLSGAYEGITVLLPPRPPALQPSSIYMSEPTIALR